MFEKFSKRIVFMVLVFVFLCGSGLPAAAKSPRGWGMARQLFMRGALTNPKQPKFIRGALQNQLNRWHPAQAFAPLLFRLLMGTAVREAWKETKAEYKAKKAAANAKGKRKPSRKLKTSGKRQLQKK